MLFIFIFILIALGLSFYFGDSPFFNFIIGVLASLLASIMYGKYKRIFSGFWSWQFFKIIFFPNKKVRVSCAYLYRIQIDGKFFLIRNKGRGNISPIGGAYQFYESGREFLNEIKAVNDAGLIPKKTEEKYQHDIRLIFSLNRLPKFMEWFQSGQGREFNVEREFFEELEEIKLLTGNVDFGALQISKYKSVNFLGSYSKTKNYYPYYHFDILNVHLSQNQQEILLTGVRKRSPKLFLASNKEIINQRLNNGQMLGETSIHVI